MAGPQQEAFPDPRYFSQEQPGSPSASGSGKEDVPDPRYFSQEEPGSPPDSGSLWSRVTGFAKSSLGYDNDVDYNTGIDSILFRAGLNAMDTPEERQAYLNSSVGEGGWRKDSGGRYLVTAQAAKDKFGQTVDKDVAIDEFGLSMGDIGDILPDALPIIGAVGAGIAATGYGAAVGVPMVAAAAGAGKLLEEAIVEPVLGLPNLQSAGEIAGDVAIEGALAASGEGIVRMLAPVGRFILGPDAWKRGAKQAETFFETKLSNKWAIKLFGKRGEIIPRATKETRDLAKEVIKRGGAPSIYQASKSPITGRIQSMMDLIFSNEMEAYNFKFIDKEARELLVRIGERALASKVRGPAGAGAIVRRGVRGIGEDAEASLMALDNAAFKTLDDLEKLLRIGKTSGLRETAGAADAASLARLGEMFDSFDTRGLSELIRTAKARGAEQWSKSYGVLDNMLGDQPIVSTHGLRAAANEIADEIPGIGRAGPLPGAYSELEKLLKYIFNQDEVLNFKQSQLLRTMIKSTFDDPKLVGSQIDRYKAMMLRSIDDMMGDDTISALIAKNAGPVTVPGEKELVTQPFIGASRESAAGILRPASVPIAIPDENIIKALTYKRVMDENYGKWISRFDNVLVKRLGLDAAKDRAGRAISAEDAGKFIMRASPSHIKSLRTIMRSSEKGRPVSLNAWDNVRGDVLKRILRGVMNSEGQVVAPAKFLRNINEMNPGAFKEIFGDTADSIKRIAKDMLLLGKAPGKLANSELRGGTEMLKALRAWKRDAIREQKTMASAMLRSVAKGKIPNDETISTLLASRNKDAVRQMRNILGPESPEWAAVQEEAMTKIIGKIYLPGDDGVSKLINGSGLAEFLDTYTNGFRSREPLIALFGKQMTNDLVLFSKMTSMLASRAKMSGGIVAASIALHPLRNLPRLVGMRVLSKWMKTPMVLRYYMQGMGFYTDTATGRLVATGRKNAPAMARAMTQMYKLIHDETRDDPWTLSLEDDDTFGAWIPNGTEQASQPAVQ